MKTLYRSIAPEQWFVYVAKTIFSKDENGIAYKNYLTLEKQCGSYPSFSEAYNRMASIGRSIEENSNGKPGYKSRSSDFCTDFYLVPVREDCTTEKDCFEPGFYGMEVIATTHVLTLKQF